MIQHTDLIKNLEEAQTAEFDSREISRQNEHMVDVRGGQWEPNVWSSSESKPRYQMDLISPICQQHIAELGNADFDIKIIPQNAAANKKTAQAFDGIIRHIENISGAGYIYGEGDISAVKSGIGGWRIDVEYTNDYDFDQDLVIKNIPNFKDRVWFDPSDMTQDKSMSGFAWCLTPMSKDTYSEKYPEGSGVGIGQARLDDIYYYKPDLIVVGEYFYKQKKKKKLVQFSNGMVFEDNKELQMVIDELQLYGVEIINRRDAECDVIYRRMFDANDYLDDEEETVFNKIPIVPYYGNYAVIEDKQVYYGEPEKLIDVQRVIDYTYSRLTEDVSLRAKTKLLITEEQERGYEAEHSTMHIDNNPKIRYNNMPNQQPPSYLSAPPPDPALVTVLQASTDYVNKISGMFQANMGANPGLQSGVAIDSQIERGNNSTFRYIQSKKKAMIRTAKILLGAIPKVYSDRQQARIVGKTGEDEYININEIVVDRQTGQAVKLYDFSKGKYDVVCSVGSSFKSQQEETVNMIVELSKIMPELPVISADIIMSNISAPGMSDIAERIREQMVNTGRIPQDQLTDEEKQRVAQIQQSQGNQITPEQQAAIGLAQAEQQKAQAQTADIISKSQERAANVQMKQQQQQFDNMLKAITLQFDKQKLDAEIDSKDAQTLKTIKDATGADAVIDPQAVNAYHDKVRDLNTDNNLTGNSAGQGQITQGTAPIMLERTS